MLRLGSESVAALACALLLVACGSSQGPKAEVIEPPAVDDKVDVDPEETPAKAPALAPLVPPPVEIRNGRMHDGYVVGGLPTKLQIEDAWNKEFDAAMSVMGKDEPGGSEIGGYASSLGMRYMRFSIPSTEDLSEATAWEFAATLSMLGKPAIIHSAEGKRVGAIFALKAFFVDDLGAEAALAVGVAAGMGDLADHVRELIGASK